MLNDWTLIREYYRKMLPRIVDSYTSNSTVQINFYDNWYLDMTPIEKNIWFEIRSYNLPLYPQFPVKNYFVDFGDPVRKIAVEADGSFYHQDKEKDIIRQKSIEKEGWAFYRIRGKYTFKTAEELFDEKIGNTLIEGENGIIDHLGGMPDDMYFSFLEENKEINSDCLVRYLKLKFYTKNKKESWEHLTRPIIEQLKADPDAKKVFDFMDQVDEFIQKNKK